MKIISCSKAKKLGLKQYFTGKPCIHGHLSPKQTSNWTCLECNRIKCATTKHRISIKKWKDKNIRYTQKYNKEYRLLNLDYHKNYEREKYKNDLNYKIAKNLRNGLNQRLKNKKKVGSAVKDLECSIDFLKNYLENKFQDGMSWNNYGKWEIDHIKPLSSFNLENREELLEACHFTNLQPLWQFDNRSKGAKSV